MDEGGRELEEFEIKSNIVDTETMDSIDRISELPEPIIHQILSYLSGKEEARTTILSNTWKSLRNSYPVLFCDESIFTSKLAKIDDEENKRKFVDYVYDSFQRLQKQNLSIQKFTLFITFDHHKEKEYSYNYSHADHWIEMAAKSNVKVLHLELYSRGPLPAYILPPTINFAYKSLTALRLRGCTLDTQILDGNTKFNSLQELYLDRVRLSDDIIRNLSITCPSITSFTLHKCYGVINFRLSGLKKLNNVNLYECINGANSTNISTVYIEVSSLHTFKYTGGEICEVLDLSGCKHLEVLNIATPAQRLLSQIDFPSFSLLRSLKLMLVCFESKTIKITNHRLEKLGLLNVFLCHGDVTISTPNLRSFMTFGDVKKSLSFKIDTSTLLKATIIVWTIDINTLWFVNLREYIRKFCHNKTLSLRICLFPEILVSDDEQQEVRFIPEDLRNVPISPPYRIKKLKVKIYSFGSNYEALVDGLLWSTCPETLYIKPGKEQNKIFIKVLCKRLMLYKESNQYCCKSAAVACWRHRLEDFRIEMFGEKTLTCDSLILMLPTLAPHQRISFKFTWF